MDSRPAEGGVSIRRRRHCDRCGNRFTTYERTDLPLVVSKRDGRREPFQLEKVRRGLERALTGRPGGPGIVEELVGRVEELARRRAPEVSSDEIGREVLTGLRQLDQVAYLRFASVYKDFQGARDFEREVAALEGEAG
ncbi:MAG: transcriptional regulator NrdR [Actinomycetota bacterium]|nr:transcriptional regulator NrdR [Actinomycetota bacterium]